MNDGGRQFFKMHPRLKAIANERLSKSTEGSDFVSANIAAEVK